MQKNYYKAGMICAIFFLLFPVSFSFGQDDHCEVILKYGIYDKTIMVSTKSGAEAFAQNFCSFESKFSQQQKSNEWGGGASILGIGSGQVDSSSSDSISSSDISKFCYDYRRNTQFGDKEIQIAHRINEVIVRAWSKCKETETEKKGLLFWLQSGSGYSKFTITAKYVALPGAKEEERVAILEEDLRVPDTISCPFTWKKDSQIRDFDKILDCTRNGNDGAIIVIRTNRDEKKVEILPNVSVQKSFEGKYLIQFNNGTYLDVCGKRACLSDNANEVWELIPSKEKGGYYIRSTSTNNYLSPENWNADPADPCGDGVRFGWIMVISDMAPKNIEQTWDVIPDGNSKFSFIQSKVNHMFLGLNYDGNDKEGAFVFQDCRNSKLTWNLKPKD
jgi:hypothetical protein